MNYSGCIVYQDSNNLFALINIPNKIAEVSGFCFAQHSTLPFHHHLYICIKLLHHLINFIQQYDPKYLALKRSLKTFLAILISISIFYDNPRMAMFAAITSLLISRSQTGLTLQDRKFSLLTTGILLSLFSVPVSIISQNEMLSLVFVIVGTFVTFFLIGLRVVPDFPAIVLLSTLVVEMAFSHTFKLGLEFAGLFLGTTILVFIIHFVIIPTRPKVRLKTQIELISQSLEAYFHDILANYPDLESGISKTHQSAAIARKSIDEFKRLWHLLGMKAPGQDQAHFPEIAKGLEYLFEYMLLIWQFRARAWESDKFKTHIIQHPQFKSIVSQLMLHYQPEKKKPGNGTKKSIQKKIQTLNKQYLKVYQDEKETAQREEWVAIFNALHSLLALTESLDNTTIENTDSSTETSISERLDGFYKGVKDSIGKLKFSNPAFRFGLRSTIIVAATMAYSQFFDLAHGFWIVLFAILLIRPNLGVSIKAGRDRLIGTLVGCVAGFVFVNFVPAGSIAFYILILLSVFFMIWFTNLNKFILMITALTFLIIGLFSLIYPSDSGVAWLRLGYTSAMVIIVIFLSFLLWPEKARKKFADALASGIESEKLYFLSIINVLLKNNSSNDVEKQKKQLTLQLTKLDEIIEATKNEILQNKVIHHGLYVHRFILRLQHTLHAMDFAAAVCNTRQEFPELENELNKFTDHCVVAFNSLITAFRQYERARDFPDLRVDFLKVRDQFRAIRGKPDPERDEITQLWNISTFIWNLKTLILELEGIKEEIDLKMDEV
jgi:uncharacterized membrane protein YccC